MKKIIHALAASMLYATGVFVIWFWLAMFTILVAAVAGTASPKVEQAVLVELLCACLLWCILVIHKITE